MGLFDRRPTSKRRADIVSIRTPTEFRMSISKLQEGRFTLAERRSLVLAQNRARAQLGRKDLSSKERMEFTEIGLIRIPGRKK